jgi:hypothetical protein
MSSVQLPDFTRLDDSALLSMRAQMRAELERLPANSAARAALIRVYDASTEEVTDRARKAWARTELGETQMDDDLRKRLLAIEVLLQEPEDISDALETELYSLRDKLQAMALS